MNAPAKHPIESAQPCPFCASHDLSLLEGCDEIDALVHCEGCGANGPLAELNGRERGDVDLEREAVDLWNERADFGRVSLTTIDVLLGAWEKAVSEYGINAPIEFWGFVGKVQSKLKSGEMKLCIGEQPKAGG